MARHGSGFDASSVLRRIGLALISARARAIMSIGIVLGLGAVGTLAAWSDTATATSGTFTTGKLDIKVGNPAVDNNPPAFSTSLTNAAIFPGDTVAAGLLVTNAAGSVANTYTISVLASDATLGNLLNSSVHSGSPVSGACSGSPVSTVTGLGTSKLFQQTTPTVGNLTRTLTVGQTDQLCISVTMPSTAVSPATPATGTITYTLTATSS
ncbi:MAG: SipW-dependent-type signal peptide-containing protein [Rhodococcus sp. (in: high G+C Gram-positive bacteria)]